MEDMSLTLMEDASPTEDHLHFQVLHPEMSLVSEIIAFFNECEIFCTVTVGEESYDTQLVSGSNRIEIDKPGDEITVDLYLEYEEGVKSDVRHLSISCMDMSPVPIVTEDIIFKNKPDHGFAMGIDFAYAVDTAKGFDECNSMRAQIRSPQDEVVTIEKSSGNFVWRGTMLLCRLSVGIKYHVRLQYESANGWGDWSPWGEFVCRRKMSL